MRNLKRGVNRSYFPKVESGLTIIEKVEFSVDERVRLSNLISNIPEDVKQEFNAKYEQGDEYVGMPLINLTYDKYGSLLAEIRR